MPSLNTSRSTANHDVPCSNFSREGLQSGECFLQSRMKRVAFFMHYRKLVTVGFIIQPHDQNTVQRPRIFSFQSPYGEQPIARPYALSLQLCFACPSMAA